MLIKKFTDLSTNICNIDKIYIRLFLRQYAHYCDTTALLFHKYQLTEIIITAEQLFCKIQGMPYVFPALKYFHAYIISYLILHYIKIESATSENMNANLK